MTRINRRSLLQGAVGFTAGLAASACTQAVRQGGSAPSGGAAAQAANVERVVDPASLERSSIRVGYVPVNDCAPFAVAQAKGFFYKYGLSVTLNREASWGTSRDGVIFGRLDASPVVSGAVTNARIGAEGARSAPMCAAMTIHRHGNAMTMNSAMWEAGLRPWREYGGDLDAFGRDFRNYFAGLSPDRRVWAVVLSSAIYEYFIRYLAAAAGINPLEEFRVIIIPPPQMVTNVRIGAMQAYMVAEPWNTRAITGNEGVGFTFAHGKEVWRGHPDRVLAVMEDFINENPNTYRSLVKAMIEACQYCDDPANRSEVAEIISDRAFTGAPPKFTEPALVGNYNYGGFDGQDRTVQMPDSTLFFDLPDDLPQPANDHSTFLWQSQSIWLMTQATRWGQIAEFPTDAEAKARQAWRTDLYREIAAELGIACPAEDYKVEPGEVFIDGIAYDPSDPVGYLNSFDIRAKRPQKIFMG
ncbi:ABC transporter substrate-binding protein [Nodosilinea sp. PGN35]|uniref:ABC transporter substrate-binding protein n=1 Tax=Nodosilinea sp. PGN35 TaxID=3020489 RepID=UPI0023B216D7|nr:CmpA/NrtA family ABC transporter substrate-binding protein [Nodosilinea sp. TSF1-S3]MDF0369314.1 CmpA/NrtA family ABC transporter substrate-binding protein [Nodosilinea sp. TSF1-S3]